MDIIIVLAMILYYSCMRSYNYNHNNYTCTLGVHDGERSPSCTPAVHVCLSVHQTLYMQSNAVPVVQ